MIKIGVVIFWYSASIMIFAVAICTASMIMNYVSVGINVLSFLMMVLLFVYMVNIVFVFV